MYEDLGYSSTVYRKTMVTAETEVSRVNVVVGSQGHMSCDVN